MQFSSHYNKQEFKQKSLKINVQVVLSKNSDEMIDHPGGIELLKRP